jgi:RNA polymerase sigma factor for flagellar operon FliA
MPAGRMPCSGVTTTGSAGDPEVSARVRDGLDLVEPVARQLRRSLGAKVPVEELMSYGHEGLLQAASSFREETGVPFRRWANLRIRGAMLDGMRAQADLPRHVYRRIIAIEAGDLFHEDALERDAAAPAITPEDADKKLEAHLAGMATAIALGLIGGSSSSDDQVVDRSPLADESLEREELQRAVREGVGERPDDEKRLLSLVYFDGLTVADAGKKLGLSKSWACRIHARAIEGLAKFLKRSRAV